MATGTCAIASKLPGLDESVGTAEQPEPKLVIMSPDMSEDMLGAGLLMVDSGAALPVDESSELSPHAARETLNRAAAAMAVSFVARMVHLPF
ncbi:hypothetical protein GCM10012284_61170 [Mangrovihabitans endophyticus]|uniref:Uncharacterized protein n=1 Tax=Mangrovihabitans endophyticus TaxID=1751298 RepID=A0A8J3C5L1_9ACTN|nr:hypothetical protein GCM10012284_61170 [Mangrovihabitans endophyticus]